MYEKTFKLPCKISRREDGYSVSLFCEAIHKAYTLSGIKAASEEEALEAALAEGKRYFNLCHKCGRWVCDEAYNIDYMACVDCILPPLPKPCPQCGAYNTENNIYCNSCGAALYYGGEC